MAAELPSKFKRLLGRLPVIMDSGSFTIRHSPTLQPSKRGQVRLGNPIHVFAMTLALSAAGRVRHLSALADWQVRCGQSLDKLTEFKIMKANDLVMQKASNTGAS